MKPPEPSGWFESSLVVGVWKAVEKFAYARAVRLVRELARGRCLEGGREVRVRVQPVARFEGEAGGWAELGERAVSRVITVRQQVVVRVEAIDIEAAAQGEGPAVAQLDAEAEEGPQPQHALALIEEPVALPRSTPGYGLVDAEVHRLVALVTLELEIHPGHPTDVRPQGAADLRPETAPPPVDLDDAPGDRVPQITPQSPRRGSETRAITERKIEGHAALSLRRLLARALRDDERASHLRVVTRVLESQGAGILSERRAVQVEETSNLAGLAHAPRDAHVRAEDLGLRVIPETVGPQVAQAAQVRDVTRRAGGLEPSLDEAVAPAHQGRLEKQAPIGRQLRTVAEDTAAGIPVQSRGRPPNDLHPPGRSEV